MSKPRTNATALILLVAIFLPQTMLVSAQDSQKPRKIVVKKDGWLVPGQNDFKQISQVVEKHIEGVAVTQKVLESPAEIIVDVDGTKPLCTESAEVALRTESPTPR